MGHRPDARKFELNANTDIVQFLDGLVTRGVDGGLEAGRQLRLAVGAYYQTNPFWHPEDKIIIYIAANLHGLTKAYTLAGIVHDPLTVRDFFVGISQSHPLTSVVDAGRQKEAADSKLKGTETLSC